MTDYSIKEAAYELNVSDKALYKRISNENFNTDFLTKIDGKTIIIMLKDQVEFLKNQLEQQNINFQEQLKLQAQSYQENLKIQLKTIKSKEAIILNMQDIIKSEQENTKKLLDCDERSREVDEKLSQIRRELVGRKAKHKKRLFSFLGK